MFIIITMKMMIWKIKTYIMKNLFTQWTQVILMMQSVRSASPADSPERKLISWLLTDEGQALAAGAGYIPLRPLEGELSNDITDPVYTGNTEFSASTGGT